MGLLERISTEAQRPRRGRKGFTQPPFWSYDQMREPFLSSMSLTGDKERIENSLEAYVAGAYKESGPVAACIVARQMVFSEARLQWQRMQSGRPGDLFGDRSLALVEKPWPNGSTGELLSRMELDVSLAGNFYATVADDRRRLGRAATGPGRRIVHARPDWVTIVIGSHSGDPHALDARIVGFLYEPRPAGTRDTTSNPVLLMPDEVCHYSPQPDPLAKFRGMSWLTPVLREIEADKAATLHKGKFFEQGATPNFIVKFDKDTSDDAFEEFVEKYKAHHQGAWNAYKTLFLAGGADVTTVGANFEQLEFSQTQGKGESRIASNAGVPPSWVGFSEGMQGSALNSGNFNSARRRFADGTIRPLWRMACAALETLVPPPEGARLWADTRDIAFLREDRIDAAAIQSNQAQTIRQLTDAGYTAESVVRAVNAEDFSLLEHSGLFSVQLQPAGTRQVPNPNPDPPEPSGEQ